MKCIRENFQPRSYNIFNIFLYILFAYITINYFIKFLNGSLKEEVRLLKDYKILRKNNKAKEISLVISEPLTKDTKIEFRNDSIKAKIIMEPTIPSEDKELLLLLLKKTIKLELIILANFTTESSSPVANNIYLNKFNSLIINEFETCIVSYSKGYFGLARRTMKEMNSYLTSLEKSIKLEMPPKASKVKSTPKTLIPLIEEKHLTLDNVISKSLYNKALTLATALEDTNLEPEASTMITSQLKQIDNFLEREITGNKKEINSELINNLKANQRYLDSLDSDWISEKKI